MHKQYLLSVVAVLAMACAGPSLIVTKRKEPIKDWKTVAVLLEEPKVPYEVLGTKEIDVFISLNSRRTDATLAAENEKKQAAIIGANSILVTYIGEVDKMVRHSDPKTILVKLKFVFIPSAA